MSPVGDLSAAGKLRPLIHTHFPLTFFTNLLVYFWGKADWLVPMQPSQAFLLYLGGVHE
jgi:hypothetical protein